MVKGALCHVPCKLAWLRPNSGHNFRQWSPTASQQQLVRSQAQGANPAVSSSEQPPSGVVLLGFPDEEVEAVQRLVTQAPVVSVQAHVHIKEVLDMLTGQQPQDSSSRGHSSTERSPSSRLAHEGRLVYLVGSTVQQQYGGAFNDTLVQAGLMPAVVGAWQPRCVCGRGGGQGRPVWMHSVFNIVLCWQRMSFTMANLW
jgi:hypothetical protein